MSYKIDYFLNFKTMCPSIVHIRHILIYLLQLNLRDGPFNLKEGGWVCFFSKKIFWCCLKNYLILVEEKKNNLIQSFCHIT
jgi:hypothetical protein